MIVVHAVWADALLHVWGEQITSNGAASGEEAIRRSVRLGADDSDQAAETAGFLSAAIEEDALRWCLGDVFDSLLVSGATASDLTLQLPHRDGRFVSSLDAAPGDVEDIKLLPCRMATLSFDPADAVDLLTTSPTFASDTVCAGGSFNYWSRVAGLVRELLSQQRFVPAIHNAGRDRYRGYWRVVVDDADTSDRLGALIASMPPLCRSRVTSDGPIQASLLVENFLWATVDALVRRCLEGDELAHAIYDRSEGGSPLQMRWLRSVVCADATLSGTPEELRLIYETVRDWLSKLEPPLHDRACRTCFRLEPPATRTTESPDAPESGEQNEAVDPKESWRLTLHVQASDDPDLVFDAPRLFEHPGDDPLILKRPFDDAREQLRADVARAARHFPPLAPCAEPSGPLECRLSLEDAYTFLRDAAPILELEGFGVWVPQWWGEQRPRLRMWLDLRPSEGQATVAASDMRLDALVRFDWRVAVGDQDLSLDEIAVLAEEKKPLVQVRGRWTEVQPTDVRTALDFLSQNRSKKMTVMEALRQCYLADDLETGLSVAGLRAHGWIENLLNATKTHQKIEHFPPPVGFKGELRPYQHAGLEWLSFLAKLGLGACLADDMGLGKTIQMIALWLHEREGEASPGPTLLVVPMSLVGNWSREIERFAPSLKVMVHHGTERLTGREFVDEVAKHDVVISTYGLAHRDLEHLGAVEWHRVALDEAQNIKNPVAKQTIAIRSLRTIHRMALTGTPVENRLSELWSIIDFLNPGHLGGASEFRRRFAVPIERNHDTDRAQRLRHLIRPFVLRRLKSDPSIQVDLPEKMEMKVFCNLTQEQAALYEALVGQMLGQIDSSGGIQRRGLILATLVKLKQICNHPAHFLADGSSLPHRSGKCDRISEMLEEVLAEGDKALVFTQFRKMGDLLKKLLGETLDCEVLFLHGGTTRKNRELIIDGFQSGSSPAPLLILSLKAGGFGLNLTAANHVFHFDRWWNPAVEDQATDRVHRIGQHRQVQVHKFVCIGTMEEQIDAVLENKRHLAENVVGSGEGWLTELSTEKLREVLMLSREAVAES